jgi:hypothetical protein
MHDIAVMADSYHEASSVTITRTGESELPPGPTTHRPIRGQNIALCLKIGARQTSPVNTMGNHFRDSDPPVKDMQIRCDAPWCIRENARFHRSPPLSHLPQQLLPQTTPQ